MKDIVTTKLNYEATEDDLMIWKEAGKRLKKRYSQQAQAIVSLYLTIRKLKR